MFRGRQRVRQLPSDCHHKPPILEVRAGLLDEMTSGDVVDIPRSTEKQNDENKSWSTARAIGGRAEVLEWLGLAIRPITVKNPAGRPKKSERGEHGSTRWESCDQPMMANVNRIPTSSFHPCTILFQIDTSGAVVESIKSNRRDAES